MARQSCFSFILLGWSFWFNDSCHSSIPFSALSLFLELWLDSHCVLWIYPSWFYFYIFYSLHSGVLGDIFHFIYCKFDLQPWSIFFHLSNHTFNFQELTYSLVAPFNSTLFRFLFLYYPLRCPWGYQLTFKKIILYYFLRYLCFLLGQLLFVHLHLSFLKLLLFPLQCLVDICLYSWIKDCIDFYL